MLSKNLLPSSNKKVLIITDSFPFPPRNGMEVTCYQSIQEFIQRGVDIKFLILYGSNTIRKEEELRHVSCNFSSEVEFIEIKESPIYLKIIQELFLVTPTYLNYYAVNKLLDIKNIISDIDFIFVPPVKGVHFYTKYIYPYIANKNIRTILHTNDCISSYYLGTFTRMFKGFEKKTISGCSYILRYFFIKHLERKYLRKFEFCLVQTKYEKIKIQKLFHRHHPSRQPEVVIKANKPSEDLFSIVYNDSKKKDILLMSHFIDNRAYSAIWFIDNVWNEIIKKYPDINLHIFGAISDSSDMRKLVKKQKNIIFNGFAKSLKFAYADKLISVVPIFQDNGQITRVSDSLSAGLPCFTTPEALSTIDGAINGVHAVSSRNAKEMTANIFKYIDNASALAQLSMNGKELVRGKLNPAIDMDHIYE